MADDLISRSELRAAAIKATAFSGHDPSEFSFDNCYPYWQFSKCIKEAPSVDAVPVVRGEWKMDTDPDDGDCRCSSCKVCIDALHKRNHGLPNALGFKLHTFYNYCPNCGARMGGEE